jgi:hypothetical protein
MTYQSKGATVMSLMKSFRFSLVHLVLLCGATVAVHAQSQVFIGAKTGQDAGACTTAAPCRNVNYALTQVAAGGEINIVESGDYAAATINKAVTVQAAPGVVATFSTAFSSCIAINAGASEVVSLRGLFLNGQGTAAQGVSGNSAAAVLLDRLTITRFTSQGIILNNTNGKNAITNTVVTNCNVGIGVTSIAAGLLSMHTAIENCQVQNCQTGYSIAANFSLNQVRATIRNSSASNCSSIGFNHVSLGGSVAVMLEGILAFNNNTAVRSTSNTVVRVSNSTITYNDSGLNTSGGGSILTRLNNTFENNSIPGAFTGTYTAK